LKSTRTTELSAILVGPFAAAGCGPVVSVAGANFPAWILCLLAGISVSLIAHSLFVGIGIDEWIAPKVIVYSCLVLVVAFLFWLLAWR
jgi:hypothetical protein